MKKSILFYVLIICVQIENSKAADVCESQNKKEILQSLSSIFQEKCHKVSNASDVESLLNTAEEQWQVQEDRCYTQVVPEIRYAFKCISGMMNKSQDYEKEIDTFCDVSDPDVLELVLKVTIKNEIDFEEIFRIAKEVLETPQKILLFKAISTLTTKGSYSDVADLYITAKNMTQDKNLDISLMEQKLLNQTLYTLAFKAWIEKLEGSHHPEFFQDLLKGPNRNVGYFVVRDFYVYLAGRTKNGKDVSINVIEELIDIALSLLESNDIEEPITGILSHILHIIRQSEALDSSDQEVKERFEKIYENLNDFEKVLFASGGEFCINMQLFNDLQEVDYRKTPAAFIRNAGTSSEPDYNWYLWANNPRGHLIRLTDPKIGVIAPNGEYDIESTIYKNLNRYAGGFIKLRNDVCSDSFNVFVQYLCLPLYEMMEVFKQSEDQPFDYVDRFIGDQSRNCVRLTLYKTRTGVIGNDI